MDSPPRRRNHLLDLVADILDSRPSRVVIIVLILVSVLPYPEVEHTLRPLFLLVFGLEFATRLTLLLTHRVERTRSEVFFLLVDLVALLSFLPLEQWVRPSWRAVSRMLRLTRLLVLLRFARALAVDVWTVLTRREQLQQFGLISASVLALVFVSSVFLSQLAIPHDYDQIPETMDGFWDRIWWAFRQVESPDNLVQNLQVHPFVGVLSLFLTISGVFIFSYLIGVGANVVDQVVRAERRRPLAFRDHTLVAGPIDHMEVLVREFVRIQAKNAEVTGERLRDLVAWAREGGARPRPPSRTRVALLGEADEPPAYLYEAGMRGVMYREGDATDLKALERVGASDVKRAVLLSEPDAGLDGDAVTIARLGALRQLNPRAHIYVEVLDSENESIVRAVGGPGTYPLDVPRFLGLFLCHHLVVPGIENLLAELLSADGSEFYTHLLVDAAERKGLEELSQKQATLSFSALATEAYDRFGVVLVGVFLGDDDLAAAPADLLVVDQLTPWLNPHCLAQDEETIPATPVGEVPTARLRGFIGVAPSYGPLRRFARRLMATATLDAAPAEVDPAPLLARAVVDPRPVERVLIVGEGVALPSLVDGLARFVPGLEILVVVHLEPSQEHSTLRRLEALAPELVEDGLPGAEGRRADLVRGGSVTLYTTTETPVAFALQILDGRAIDAAVFLSDAGASDPDARTSMRVLRLARELRAGRVMGERMHVLVELSSFHQGHAIERQLDPRCCGYDDEALRVTLVSTAQIRNYFMVHSAFVPGVTDVYSHLLGTVGQEFVRLDLPRGLEEPTRFPVLRDSLAACGCVPLAVELADGSVLTNPTADVLLPRTLRAIFVIADNDALAEVFAER